MIILITGLMASGKSTVAEGLARRLPRAVHLRGDVFRRMIVSGRAEMSENPSPEALKQLQLRYRLSACAAMEYAKAGFDVVLQDNYYGEAWGEMLSLLADWQPRAFVLNPDVAAIGRREAARGKTGYHQFDVLFLYQEFQRTTPRLGTWLDTSTQSPEETVEQILELLQGP